MMNRSHGWCVVVTVVVASCGGSSDHPDAARFDAHVGADAMPPDAMLPDAAPPDAGPVPDSLLCLMSPSYPVLNLGNATTPFAFPATMTAEGNWAISLFGSLGTLEPELGNHGIAMTLIDNLGMFAAAPFSGGPILAPTPLDPDASCGGCIDAFGGYADGPLDLSTSTQIYTATAGTLTLTTFDPLVVGSSSHVFGTYSNVVLAAQDATGNPLPCTATVDQLDFFFDVQWTVPPAVTIRSRAELSL